MGMKKVECEGVGDNNGFFEVGVEQTSSNNGELLPLSEAPKDGTYILIHGQQFDGLWAVVCWDEEANGWMLDDGKSFEIPVRRENKLDGWIPLPKV